MTSVEKIKKLIDDNKYDIPEFETYSFCIDIPGKPESYARERKGRGKHFYNPKSGKMTEIRKNILKSLSLDERNILLTLVNTTSKSYNPDTYYTVSLTIKYYLPIPKGDSLKLSAQKEMNLIRPITRPDIDNYDKFILDTLHEVFYDDDKRVVSIHSEKFYSLEPRTIIIAEVCKIKS